MERAERLDTRPVLFPTWHGEGRELIGNRLDKYFATVDTDRDRMRTEHLVATGELGHHVERSVARRDQVVERVKVIGVWSPIFPRQSIFRCRIEGNPAAFVRISALFPAHERLVGILPCSYFIECVRKSDEVRSVRGRRDIEVAGIEGNTEKSRGSRTGDDEVDRVPRQDFEQAVYVRWLATECHGGRA